MRARRFILDIELTDEDEVADLFHHLMDLADSWSPTQNFDLSAGHCPFDACFPHELTP